MSLFDDVSPKSPSSGTSPSGSSGKKGGSGFDSIFIQLPLKIFKGLFGLISAKRESDRYKPKFRSNKIQWRRKQW